MKLTEDIINNTGRQQSLTSWTNQILVELLVDFNRLDDGIFEDCLLLFENLLRGGHLGLTSLDLDINRLCIPSAGNVNLGSGGLAQLIKCGTSLTDKRGHLSLLNGNGGRERRVPEVLNQREDLVAGFVGTPLRPADYNFVGRLLSARFSSVAHRVAVGLVVLAALRRLGEEDVNLVFVLETVDEIATGTNEFPMELGLDLENVSGFVRPSTSQRVDMALGSLGLGLRSLELNLAIVDLNFDVEPLAKLADVATVLTDEVIGKLLGEVEGRDKAAFFLIFNLLRHESGDLVLQRLDSRSGAPESDDRLGRRDPDRDLVCRSFLLLLFDESSQAFVEATSVSLTKHVTNHSLYGRALTSGERQGT